MKIKALLLSTIFAACIIPSLAQAAKTEEGKGEKKAPDHAKLFAKLDADESGELSKEEVAKNKGLVKKFDKLDADESGELSLSEFKAGSSKKEKKPKKEKEEDSGDE
ncbi:MAG: hypothetical protein ACSHX4_14645 [Opitutaceae bacterium]